MITHRIRLSAVLACLVGLAAIACATWLNVEHAANSDATSPIGTALIVFGLMTAACAIAAPKTWAQGRRILACLIVIAAGSGELFGLATSIERMAFQRAESERTRASKNISRQIAADALSMARHELVDVSKRALEATRGGCGKECLALRDVETIARQRVGDAERALADLGAEAPTGSPIAKLLNVDPNHLEIGLSALFGLALTLGGAGLLAFGTHNPLPAGPDGQVHSQQPGTDNDRTADVSSPSGTPVSQALATSQVVGQRGQPDLAGQIVEMAKASNGRLDKSVRGLAALIGKPKSTVHTTLTGLVAAGVLSKAGDGAGYVLASLR